MSLLRWAAAPRGRAVQGLVLALAVSGGLALDWDGVHAQRIGIETRDSIDGMPTASLYVGAWLKLHGLYDFSGTPSTSSLAPPLIPLGPTVRDPQFAMDMYQTRLHMDTRIRPADFGVIQAYIETDFYGDGGGGLRLRHAWLSYTESRLRAQFLFGQTWSVLTDTDAWPNITDFDGPPTGVWTRQTQIRFTKEWAGIHRLATSLESPSADLDRSLEADTLALPANQNIPEIVAHYRYTQPWGHVQLGAVLRHVTYESRADTASAGAGRRAQFTGFGTALSSVVSLREGREILTFQVLGGWGISRYMVGFSGLGADAISNGDGTLSALPVVGGYVGFQHFWDEDLEWSTTAVAGGNYITDSSPRDLGRLFEGGYFSVNIFWQPTDPLEFGAEFLYGTHWGRTVEYPDGAYGDGSRLQFTVQYTIQ